MDRLLVIWKSDLSNKIKPSIFPAAVLYGCITWTLTKCMERKLDCNCTKNAVSCIEQVLEATLHKAAAIWKPTTHLENHPNKQDMWDTAGEVRVCS